MKDIYLMDKTTGELIPAMKAIGDFYKTHAYNERWIDYFEETNIEVENSFINKPNFANCIR